MHSDALGEIARGQEVVEFACGISHLLKGGHSESVSTGVDVHSKRDPLGVVGIISPFNFPAMVPMWFFPIAIAAGNTVVLKPSEKDPSAAIWIAAALEGGRSPRRRLQRAAGRQGRRRRAARPAPTSQAISFVGSTPIARVRLRAGQPRTASASRPSAAPRTTWSCCPTPTSTWPPTRRSTPATAARASAAWRSACWSRSARSATSSSPGSPTAPAPCVIGDGARPPRAVPAKEADMGPLVTQGPPRQGRRRSSTPARRAGAKVVVDGREVAARGARGRLLARPDAVRPRHCRTWTIYSEEIFGPVLSVVRVDTYEEARRAGQRQPVRQRHRGLHQRRRRGPRASRPTSRSA